MLPFSLFVFLEETVGVDELFSRACLRPDDCAFPDLFSRCAGLEDALSGAEDR